MKKIPGKILIFSVNILVFAIFIHQAFAAPITGGEPYGYSCDASDPCASDQCIAGICGGPSAGSVGIGGQCTDASQCASGDCSASGNVCVSSNTPVTGTTPDGQSCNTSADCADGDCGAGNICGAAATGSVPDGGTCYSSTECSLNDCSGGYCGGGQGVLLRPYREPP